MASRKIEVKMAVNKLPYSLLVISTSICAALYAAGAYATSYIVSPWGTGQFRPAVVIPAFFAIIFGPIPAAIGAALGTLIADSVRHGQFYMKSLLAAVPGNFVGFFVMGYFLQRKFTWSRFLWTTLVTLVAANFVVAVLAVPVFTAIYLPAQFTQTSPVNWLFISVGLTLWWFATMLPFVLLITPALIRAASLAFPGIVPAGVASVTLRQEFPRTKFALALLAPGVILVGIGLATTYTQLGNLMAIGYGTARAVVLALIQLMFYATGGVLAVLGIASLASRKFFGTFEIAEKQTGLIKQTT